MGKVLYRKASGLADLEERTPITTATNFRLASVTKQFTATAVLLLAERGELSLDDPLPRFFPGFARAAHGVTVRHLLGHTSELLDYEELIPPGTTVPLKDKDVLDLVGKQDKLYFAPGSQFRYSNTGNALLALIVEKVSGRSFAQFLKENIFDPLGMAGTVAYEEEGRSTLSRYNPPIRRVNFRVDCRRGVPGDRPLVRSGLISPGLLGFESRFRA